MAITFTATDSVDYEPGVYRAKLKELETAESSIVDEKTGQPGFYMKWIYELLHEGYEGHTLRGNSSMNFGPRAKARQWAEALLGRRIESGESIDEDDLIGQEGDLMVRLEELTGELSPGSSPSTRSGKRRRKRYRPRLPKFLTRTSRKHRSRTRGWSLGEPRPGSLCMAERKDSRV